MHNAKQDPQPAATTTTHSDNMNKKMIPFAQ